LGVANHALRQTHKNDGKRRVTTRELAAQVGQHRSHLTTRAKDLGVDLEPYTLLYGPPVFDPLMVIEKT
jgi:hypothetical protein